MSRIITGTELLAAFKEKGWKVDNKAAQDAQHTTLDLDEFTILPQGSNQIFDLNRVYYWNWATRSIIKTDPVGGGYNKWSICGCYVLKRAPVWHELE